MLIEYVFLLEMTVKIPKLWPVQIIPWFYEINEEIEAENVKMSQLQDIGLEDEDYDSPVRNAAKVQQYSQKK